MATIDEESGSSELLPSLIKCNTSILVKLRRLLIMWLTSVMLTPLLVYCIISSIDSANAASIILLIGENVTTSDDHLNGDNFTDIFSTESSTVSHETTTVSPVTTSTQRSSLNRSGGKHDERIIQSSKSIALPLNGVKKNKIDCMINSKRGFTNPTNVYQCHVTQKCCLEYAKPSCCGTKSTTQIIREQVTLWGGLFGILGVIATIVFCRRRDNPCDLGTFCSLVCCFLCTRPSNKISAAPVVNTASDSGKNSSPHSENNHQTSSLIREEDGKQLNDQTGTNSSIAAVSELLIDKRRAKEKALFTSNNNNGAEVNGRMEKSASQHSSETHHFDVKTAWTHSASRYMGTNLNGNNGTSNINNSSLKQPRSGGANNLIEERSVHEVIQLQRLY